MVETTKDGVGSPPKPPPVSVKQDGPRPGGYKPLDYTKRVGSARPRNAWPWIAAFLVFEVWACRRWIGWSRERRKIEQERLEMRTYVYPYLQAEEDRILRQLRDERVEEEKKIMGDVPDWNYDDNVLITRKAPYLRDRNGLGFLYDDLQAL